MITIPKNDKWLKGVIIREKTKELMRENNHFRWLFTNYIYIPRNVPKKKGVELFCKHI
jgi:hypothetical protein